MDHSLSSLCATKALFIPHETVCDLMRRCPRIADAFWRDTLIDAAVFREWILNLGRREAYGRMAHLLCDTGSGRWTRIEDSWVIEQRVGWCAMRRGGEPWRGLLII